MVRQRKFLPSSPRSPLVLANSSSSSAASSTLKRKRDDDDDVDWETVVFRIEYDAPKGRKKPAAAKGKKKQKQKKGDTVTQGVQNDGYLVQSSPFKHGRLNDIRYRVEPGASWDEGRVYPTCTSRSPSSPSLSAILTK